MINYALKKNTQVKVLLQAILPIIHFNLLHRRTGLSNTCFYYAIVY